MSKTQIVSGGITDGTIVTADIADDAVTAAKATGLGITEADQWRLTAFTNFNAGNNDITSNWERADSDGAGYFGTGITESSGIFSFPSTGYYLIIGTMSSSGQSNTGSYINMNVMTTLDNSSYDQAFRAFSASPAVDSNFTSSCSFILDVTNTTNIKLKMSSNAQNAYTVYGYTDRTVTGFTFIKLGDT
tara:strand:+ start:602 stop:1168 length:567 start_codon:yes stop_codon:yes gene_type:complete